MSAAPTDSRDQQAERGPGTMLPRITLLKPAIITRRIFSVVIRALVVTTMSFGIAFGFLSGTMSQGAHYDPNAFAIGVAALFGAACGAMGLLISRIHQMKVELRRLEAHLEEASDRNWEISEAQERAKNFFEAQGDVIVRRDGGGTITYANDAFCALAGPPTAPACTTRRSPRRAAHAGSLGARFQCASMAAARCKASAAT
jgi:PAS domain-containing protein